MGPDSSNSDVLAQGALSCCGCGPPRLCPSRWCEAAPPLPSGHRWYLGARNTFTTSPGSGLGGHREHEAGQAPGQVRSEPDAQTPQVSAATGHRSQCTLAGGMDMGPAPPEASHREPGAAGSTWCLRSEQGARQDCSGVKHKPCGLIHMGRAARRDRCAPWGDGARSERWRGYCFSGGLSSGKTPSMAGSLHCDQQSVGKTESVPLWDQRRDRIRERSRPCGLLLPATPSTWGPGSGASAGLGLALPSDQAPLSPAPGDTLRKCPAVLSNDYSKLLRNLIPNPLISK